MSEQITETQMHHFICAWCDNLKCVRGTDKCEFEQWKKRKDEEQNDRRRTKKDS